jgi:hypothetical protein
MKIEFTKCRQLDALNITAYPGTHLEASETVPAELLQAYVSNGIAVVVPDKPTKNDAKNIEGGE